MAALGTLSTLAALAAASPLVATWIAIAFVSYALWLREIPTWRRVGVLTIGETRKTLRRWDLASISIQPVKGRKRFAVVVDSGAESATLQGRQAVAFLAGILPRVNWDGGSEQDIRTATGEIDAAEGALATAGGREYQPLVWERVAECLVPESVSFAQLSVVPRLALEMAAAEEAERQIMAAEAAKLTGTAVTESEIAQIADDMFLPTEIPQRVQRLRSRQED